ncbi:MAG: hypothetical protein ABS62_05645 [Microbacterium sp. SCN 70-200]|nr:MAG: hypothetical protein ABS62_05645 [Microbacterium sp. SCN 70-200]OJV85139.1 MAG: hypothetical protein BGO46_11210 [Microbacterium sp. 70-16]
MSQHVAFIIGYPALLPEAHWILNDGTTIHTMEFHDVLSMAKFDDARYPVSRFVRPHPKLARHVGLVHQCQPDPHIAARVRNREPRQ